MLVAVLLLATWQGEARAEPEAVVATLGDDGFFESIASEAAWVVEFYAPWCASSQQLAPAFDSAARRSTEDHLEAKFGMVDISANSKLKSTFEVKTFPRVAVFAPWARKVIGGRVTDGLSWVAHSARSADDLHWLAARASGPWPRLASHMDEVASIALGDSGLAGRPPPVVFVLTAGASRQSQERFRKLAVERRLQSPVFIRLEGGGGPASDGSAVDADWLPPVPGAGAIWRLEAGVSPRPWAGPASDGSDAGDEFDASAADSLGAWIDSSSFRAVTELDRMNFRRLADDPRRLVVGVYDPADERRTTFLRKALFRLASGQPVVEAADGAVVTLPEAVRGGFLFGMLDGVEFAAFADRYRGGEEGGFPRVLVMDHASNQYFVDAEADEPEELLQFLLDIHAGLHPAIDVSATVLPWWWSWEQRASGWLRSVNGAAEEILVKPVLGLLEAVDLREAGDPVDTATRATIAGIFIGVVMVFVAAGCLVCSCAGEDEEEEAEEELAVGSDGEAFGDDAFAEYRPQAEAAAVGEAGSAWVPVAADGLPGDAATSLEAAVASGRPERVEVRYEGEVAPATLRAAAAPAGHGAEETSGYLADEASRHLVEGTAEAAEEEAGGLRRRGVELAAEAEAAEAEEAEEEEEEEGLRSAGEGSVDSDGGGWTTVQR